MAELKPFRDHRIKPNALPQTPLIPLAATQHIPSPVTDETAKEHHRRGIVLEQNGDSKGACIAYHQAASAYSFLAITDEREGDMINAYTNHKNSAASRHNSLRLETDPNSKMISAKAAIAEFERAAICASKIGLISKKLDQKAKSHIHEAECLETAYADCLKIKDNTRARDNLLKAVIARINAAVYFAHIEDADESDKNIRTAHAHFGAINETNLQNRFQKCDSWEKIIEFSSGLITQLNAELAARQR